MPRKVAAGLQGGYCGMAELVHGRAAQPGAAVTCGVQPDVPAPSPGGQGVRVSPGDLGFQVLETVSLTAPAEQSCVCDVVEEQHHLSQSPTDPGRDQFLVSRVGSRLGQGFPISHFIQPKKLGDAAQ